MHLDKGNMKKTSIVMQIKNHLLAFVIKLILVIVLFLAFTLMTKGSFAKASTIFDILNLMAIPLVIASGIHLIIIMGGIDLSCEGFVALSGIVLARFYNYLPIGFTVFLFAIILGASIGFINGFLHVKFKTPSFIITLGLSWFCLGIATLLAKGQTIPLQNTELQTFVNGRVLGGLPVLFLVALLVWSMVFFFQKKTPFGTYLVGIGVNESLVSNAGISVNKFKIFVFVCAGMLYGIATVLLMARLNSANVRLGNNLVFPSITAIVVGGVALSGGKGNAFNVLVGVAVVSILNMGLIMLKVNPYIQGAVNGTILIVSIILTTSKHKLNFVR